MKASERDVMRALDAPDAAWRIVLLHGPDEAGTRMLGERFAATMGAGAERVDLDGALLKSDPARLSDEATALSMFGDARWIRVEGGDELLPAIEALLEAPRGCPVIVLAANLKATSALLKRALAAPDIVAFASWKPDAGRADAIAVQLARTLGVRLDGEAARLLAEAVAGDRALMLREIEKLAVYVDAAPDRPRAVTAADVGAIGAAVDVRETWTLVDALFDAAPDVLAAELGGEAATAAIPALRAVARRALMLARAKASLQSKAFGREKEAVDRQSRRWSPATLTAVHAQAMAVEAAIKQPGAAGEIVAHHAMLASARAAARRG